MATWTGLSWVVLGRLVSSPTNLAESWLVQGALAMTYLLSSRCSIFRQVQPGPHAAAEQDAKKISRNIQYLLRLGLRMATPLLLSHSIYKKSYKVTLQRGIGYHMGCSNKIFLTAPSKQEASFHIHIPWVQASHRDSLAQPWLLEAEPAFPDASPPGFL